MPRQRLIRSDFLPYHVTARTNNRGNFPLPLKQVWEIITRELLIAHVVFEIEIHGFVLMSNHFHLILTTPAADLGKVMGVLMSNITRAINRAAGRTGHVFGGPHWRSLIDSPEYYAVVLKYLYRNPVRAGIVDRVEDYPLSTLYGRIGMAQLPFPLFHPRCGYGLTFVPNDIESHLAWLNQAFKKEEEEAIQKGLMLSRFSLESAEPVQNNLTIG